MRPYALTYSVVEKRLKDKDEDLKIGPRGSLRNEDKDFPRGQQHCCEAPQYDEIDMNLNLTGAQWQLSHPCRHCKIDPKAAVVSRHGTC